jgi:hypothetical protein
MMSRVEQLGEERRLVFTNVANGVPIQQVMSAFRKSEKEVMDDVRFVAKKITEYRFSRRAKPTEKEPLGRPCPLPPLGCSTLAEITWNRLALLETLGRLSDIYLGTSLVIGKIYIGALDDPHVMQEAKGRNPSINLEVSAR